MDHGSGFDNEVMENQPKILHVHPILSPVKWNNRTPGADTKGRLEEDRPGLNHRSGWEHNKPTPYWSHLCYAEEDTLANPASLGIKSSGTSEKDGAGR